MSIKQTEALVEKLILNNRSLGDDDVLLWAAVCRVQMPLHYGDSLAAVLMNHVSFGLPPYGTVSRARRKLQDMTKNKKWEQYCSSDKLKALRKKNEEKFLKYSREQVVTTPTDSKGNPTLF